MLFRSSVPSTVTTTGRTGVPEMAAIMAFRFGAGGSSGIEAPLSTGSGGAPEMVGGADVAITGNLRGTRADRAGDFAAAVGRAIASSFSVYPRCNAIMQGFVQLSDGCVTVRLREGETLWRTHWERRRPRRPGSSIAAVTLPGRPRDTNARERAIDEPARRI